MKLVRPETMTLPDEERFLAASRFAAVARCKTRILELDGEILGEIPTDEDEKFDEGPVERPAARRPGLALSPWRSLLGW